MNNIFVKKACDTKDQKADPAVIFQPGTNRLVTTQAKSLSHAPLRRMNAMYNIFADVIKT